MADWDERYGRGEHATLEPHHLLIRVAETLPAGVALDVACGAGRHALYLARRGWRVTAVDASKVGIEMTKERARALGVEVDARVADLEQNGFEIEGEAYDLICDFYYLQRDLWPKLRDGVRPGGVLVAAIHLMDEDAEQETRNPAFLLQPGELRAEFDGWQLLHYHETSLNDEDAGEHHHRTAEIVARKSTI
jgi:tellurite methyltransferase